MKGHIQRKIVAGKPRYYIAISRGIQDAQHCPRCRRNHWPDQGRLDRCPKCGGDLEEVRARREDYIPGGFARKRDAEAKLRSTLGELEGGSYTAPVKQTLAEYLRKVWLPGIENELAPNTKSNYETYLGAYIIPKLGSLELQTIKLPILIAFEKQLAISGKKRGGGLSQRTIRNIRGTLHTALADAVEWGYLNSNPATRRRRKRGQATNGEGRRREGVLVPKETQVFVEGTRDHPLHPAFVLAATSGLRRSELLALPMDFDAEAGEIEVTRKLVMVDNRPRLMPRAKTDAGERILRLDRRTLALLVEHRGRMKALWLEMGRPEGWNPDNLLFCKPDGTFINPNWFTREVKKITTRLGLPPTTPHRAFRHSYATALIGSGLSEVEVSGRLGHANPSITRAIYQHYMKGHDSRVAEEGARIVLGEEAK